MSNAPASSVLDAHAWLSVWRAFNTLDDELRPEPFNISAADYPFIKVDFSQREDEAKFGSIAASLHEASTWIIGHVVKSERASATVTEALKGLVDAPAAGAGGAKHGRRARSA